MCLSTMDESGDNWYVRSYNGKMEQYFAVYKGRA